MSDVPEYVVDRLFDAPRSMVWRAWTDPELLARWYGPGVETIIHKFDLKPGGEWLNEMKWGDKSDLSKVVFQEVVPGEKLVWHHSSSDSDWNIIANPMMADASGENATAERAAAPAMRLGLFSNRIEFTAEQPYCIA